MSESEVYEHFDKNESIDKENSNFHNDDVDELINDDNNNNNRNILTNNNIKEPVLDNIITSNNPQTSACISSINKNNNNIPDNSLNKTTEELAMWKKNEQIKFKNYLRQVEIDFLNKLSNDADIREEERDKQLKLATSELQKLILKTKKKVIELEAREAKITTLEEEMKIKINEISRQLSIKNDEIVALNKKHKEEKAALDKEIKYLNKIITTKTADIDELELVYKNYKKEIEESPISVLRMELNKRNIEYEEAIKEKNKLINLNYDIRKNMNNLKSDLVSIKKKHEQEKELILKQKLDEIEKLKFEIYNQKLSNVENNEIKQLKEAIIELKKSNINNNIEHNNATSNAYTKGSINTGTFNNCENNNNETRKFYKIVSLENNKNNDGNVQHKANINMNISNNINLQKLIDDKNQLLASGLYTETDKVIIDMQNRINKFIPN